MTRSTLSLHVLPCKFWAQSQGVNDHADKRIPMSLLNHAFFGWVILTGISPWKKKVNICHLQYADPPSGFNFRWRAMLVTSWCQKHSPEVGSLLSSMVRLSRG